MTKIKVKLPLTPSYKKDSVAITKTEILATLDLTEGLHSFKSKPMPVGTFAGLEVFATLSFTYSFDKKENKFTINGNEDITEDQLQIVTSLGDSDGLSYFHRPNDIGQNLKSQNMWSAHLKQSPLLSEAISKTAQECNTILVKTIMDSGVQSVLQKGAAPIVTTENVNDFKRMFGETVKKMSNDTLLSEVERMQIKVNSTYVGTVTWSLNYQFANVIGSTMDPLPSGVTSWLSLWRDKCNGGANTTKCSSYNYFSKDTTWTCSSVFVGGHVIPGTVAKNMAKGSTVYIFPICNVHNGSDPNSMKSLYNPDGVQLKYW